MEILIQLYRNKQDRLAPETEEHEIAKFYKMTNFRIFILQPILLEWLDVELIGTCNLHRKTYSEL